VTSLCDDNQIKIGCQILFKKKKMKRGNTTRKTHLNRKMQRYDSEDKKEKISNLYLSEYCGRKRLVYMHLAVTRRRQ
jgi:hypothetical protein